VLIWPFFWRTINGHQKISAKQNGFFYEWNPSVTLHATTLAAEKRRWVKFLRKKQLRRKGPLSVFLIPAVNGVSDLERQWVNSLFCGSGKADRAISTRSS